MTKITAKSTLEDVAAIISTALERAGIAATLSGGAAVSIYSNNEYLAPVLEVLGFEHTGIPRMSQFSHPLIEWFIEFPPTPLTFGHLYVTHEECAVIDLPAGQLRIVTPTQSVMDPVGYGSTRRSDCLERCTIEGAGGSCCSQSRHRLG
jgi:hypothetical protein